MENNSDDKKFKIVFVPGCFDGFEGTQEELDEMIAEVTRMAEDGTLLENSTTLVIDEVEDEELAQELRDFMADFNNYVAAQDADDTLQAAKDIEAARKRRLN